MLAGAGMTLYPVNVARCLAWFTFATRPRAFDPAFSMDTNQPAAALCNAHKRNQLSQ